MCTMTANAHSDLQNTRNPASAFQSGRPSSLLGVRLLLWRGAGLTDFRSDDSSCTLQAIAPHRHCWPLSRTLLGKEPPNILSSNVSTRMPRLPLFYTQGCKQASAGNYSDLLTTFWELEQAASKLRLPRAATHAEAVPGIYWGSIYSSWNWWRLL